MLIGCLTIAAIGITQMVGCFALMEDYWGWSSFGAIAVMTLLLLFRLVILLAIGCFFGALLVWEWPWYGAFAISFPAFAAGILVFTLSSLSGAIAARFNKK